MRKVFFVVISVLLLFFIFTYIKLRTEKINCSTFMVESNKQFLGCKLRQEFGDGLELRVANLRRYFFLFDKFLFLDIVQVIDGKNIHHLYLAKVYNKSLGISVNIRPTREISTDPNEKRLLFNIKDFKKWLDENSFVNKQVVALLYTKPGEKRMYLVGINVYNGDVKK